MRAIWILLALLLVLAPVAACGKDEDGKSAKSGGDDDDDDKPKKKKKKKKKDDCEAIYEKETECNHRKIGKRKKRDRDGEKKRRGDDDDDEDDAETEKDEFLKMCETMMSSKAAKEMEDEIECAHQDTCEDYKTCKDAVRGKKRAARITKDLEAGKVKDAFSSCSWSPESFSDDAFKKACKEVFAAVEKVTDPEELRRMEYQCTGSGFDKMVKAYPDFAKTCKTLAATAYTKLMEKVTAARDSGKRDYMACHSLEQAAKTIDGGTAGDSTVKAKAACAEMNTAESVQRGIASAKDYAARKKAMLPYQCTTTLDELAKIESAWAKSAKEELVKACFVDMGKVILELEGKKDMRYYCPYTIKELINAVEKHGLAATQPDLDAALKKLPAICFKKTR